MTVEIVKAKLNVCLQELASKGNCDFNSVAKLIHACASMPDNFLNSAPQIKQSINVFNELGHSDNNILTQLIEWIVEDLTKVYEDIN